MENRIKTPVGADVSRTPPMYRLWTAKVLKGGNANAERKSKSIKRTGAILKADQGLRAFAQQPANRLTLAYTATGKIVGQATLAPIDDWWQDIGNAYEIAVYEGLGISGFDYRALISRLFAAHGFTEYLTSEPNIRMDPANILVAHLGRHLEEETINRFFQRLLKSETLPGL